MAYVKDIKVQLLCRHNDCKYATKLGGGYYCNYMEIEGHSRPTKPTPDCYLYEGGPYEHIRKHISTKRT